MLQMIKGCRINDPSILFEGYCSMQNGWYANVGADKLTPLFERFIRLHNDYCFVILEVPTNQNEETDPKVRHKDVHYLDGLTPDKAIEFLHTYERWLIHDGLATFGIGIHSGGNELLRGKYNMVSLYTRTPEKYHDFFEELEIPYAAELDTAWDYFTDETPGDSFALTFDGVDIYGLVEHLKQYGLYFAERRVEVG